MNHLPQNNNLPIDKLVQIFDDTSASYKFLLFKAILESVNLNKIELKFDDLALRAISYAWYSIHFYRIRLGRVDRMTGWVNSIDESFANKTVISVQDYNKIYETLREIYLSGKGKIYEAIKKYINEYGKLVPFRLISPFFSTELIGKKDYEKNVLISSFSKKPIYKSIYQIQDGSPIHLIVPEDWADYLKTNYRIVEGWWRSNYIHYLQKNNPTILSISTKLEPPIERNMGKIKILLGEYFKVFQIKPICFYSGSELNTISHDHFLPWSFFGSDPLYNFVPTTRSINSQKSDHIPSSSKYLNKFALFQFGFFTFLQKVHKNDCIGFFQDLKLKDNPSKNEFLNSLEEFYKPLFLTAKNQGFASGWIYQN